MADRNTAQRIEAQARAALRDLMSKYDIAEYRAQQHAADMVDIVAGFARDETKPDAFRRQCALDVLDRAYGTVTVKSHITMAAAQVPADDPIGREIDKAARNSFLYLKISEYLGNGTPFDLWPTEVREAAGDMAEAFEEIDGAGLLTIDNETPAG